MEEIMRAIGFSLTMLLSGNCAPGLNTQLFSRIKVYVVTGDARIGILNLLDSQPRVRMLEVHGGDQAPGCLFLRRLASSGSIREFVESEQYDPFKDML
ncbi:hypothetical protein D5086_029745 [Populus alba]|uniref:Uncharacterized protein n=1 Tax=Populus alba TaxID=43335 RepID=A0ACC4AUI2_POPAL